MPNNVYNLICIAIMIAFSWYKATTRLQSLHARAHDYYNIMHCCILIAYNMYIY